MNNQSSNVKRNHGNRKNQDGAALGIVLVVLVVTLMLGLGLLQLSGATAFEASKNISTTHAFWAAEAGLEHIKAIGNKERFPYEFISVDGKMLYGEGVLKGTTANGRYEVDVEDLPGHSNANFVKKYLLRSTGISDGNMKQVVETVAETKTFATYMHASDSEGNVYFGPQDVLDGAVHSNGPINLWGTPRILGFTTSAASDANYRNGATTNTFEGGFQFNHDDFDFTRGYNDIKHIDHMKEHARSGGLELNGDHEIIFYRDGGGILGEEGTFSYKKLGSSDPPVTNSLKSLSKGVIYVNGEIEVSGIVDGDITLASDEAILIMSNTVYESALTPFPNPFDETFDYRNINDTLGLIAKEKVEVQGTTDIEIHAAVMVTEGEGQLDGFGAANRYEGIGTPSIIFYGSLSQFRRGIVGTTGGRGFRKNYKYNVAFLETPPPNWPYTEYVMYGWEHYTTK